jgi:hypothetical protein
MVYGIYSSGSSVGVSVANFLYEGVIILIVANG